MPEGARQRSIEVTDEEFVVARGTVRVRWFVQLNDGWIGARQYPGARDELLERAPGSVYRIRFELDLTVGTRLLRVESRPAKSGKKSAVEHLLGGPVTARRQTTRRYYQVSPRGTLEPVRS